MGQGDSYSRDQSIFGASDSEEEVPERTKKIGEAKLDSDNSESDIVCCLFLLYLS